jgi:hypothetical protein
MDRPSWYRKARIAGVIAAVPGYLTLFAIYPLYGHSAGHDWYPTVGIAAAFLVAAGTILVLAPLVHDLPGTMKRICEPTEGERTRRR